MTLPEHIYMQSHVSMQGQGQRHTYHLEASDYHKRSMLKVVVLHVAATHVNNVVHL